MEPHIMDENVGKKDVKVLGTGVPDFTGTTKPPKYKGFMLSENNDTLAGPFVGEDINAVTNSSDEGFLAVTQGDKVITTDLTQFKDTVFEQPPGGLWWETKYPFGENEDGVVGSSTENSFHYRGVYLPTPFDEPVQTSGSIKNPLFFRNAYLAIFETNWIHLSDEHNEKQVHRLDLSFHKNSFGHVWGFVGNEEKKYSGQYKGLIKEHMKVFTNIRGRRFKIKLLIASHNKYPWALREVSVGHLMGKSF
jgi:hypothetical protein